MLDLRLTFLGNGRAGGGGWGVEMCVRYNLEAPPRSDALCDGGPQSVESK